MKLSSRLIVFIIISLLLSVSILGCGNSANNANNAKTVTDMAGRTVALPAKISRVVTAGSIPAINGCLLAMGKGSLIVNGLPDNVKERCKYEFWFAPNLENQVGIAIDAPNIETILSLNPDVVFTDSMPTVEALESSKVNVVYITFDAKGQDATIDQVKAIIQLIGQVFNDTKRAKNTVAFFDEKNQQISKVISSIPQDQRPKVLYGDISNMTASYVTSDWCITKAGGVSVAAYEGRVEVMYKYSIEQLLAWDPDILFVLNSKNVDFVKSNSDLANISAVKNNRIYVVPSCMGYFGGASPEIPVTVEWMASKIYPDKFPEADMKKDVVKFYKDFYGYELTSEQLELVLKGR